MANHGSPEDSIRLSRTSFKNLLQFVDAATQRKLPLNKVASSSEGYDDAVMAKFESAYGQTGVRNNESTRLHRVGIYGIAVGATRNPQPELLLRQALKDEVVFPHEEPILREFREGLGLIYTPRPEKPYVGDHDAEVRVHLKNMLELADIQSDYGSPAEHIQLGCWMIGAAGVVSPLLRQEFIDQARSTLVD